MVNKRQEIPYLNLLRVIAIYFVILLHCVSPFLQKVGLFGQRAWLISDCINAITRMGVPCLFMISGYLLLSDERSLDIKSFYKKRLPRILIPLFVWNVLYFIYDRVITKQTIKPMEFLSQLFNNGSSYHLWFVYTIFGIYLIIPFLKRIVDACTQRQVLILLSIILLTSSIRPLVNEFTSINFFLFDPLIEGYVGFVLVGYLLGSNQLSRKMRGLIYIGGVIGLLIGIYGNYVLSSPSELNLFFNGGYQINQYLAAIALFTAVKQIPIRQNSVFFRFINSLSKLTFGIYFIHILVLVHYTSYWVIEGSPFRVTMTIFFVTASISTVVIYILSKIKFVKKLIM